MRNSPGRCPTNGSALLICKQLGAVPQLAHRSSCCAHSNSLLPAPEPDMVFEVCVGFFSS